MHYNTRMRSKNTHMKLEYAAKLDISRVLRLSDDWNFFSDVALQKNFLRGDSGTPDTDRQAGGMRTGANESPRRAETKYWEGDIEREEKQLWKPTTARSRPKFWDSDHGERGCCN